MPKRAGDVFKQQMIENYFNAVHQWMGKETLTQAGAQFLVTMIIMKDVLKESEFVQQKCTSMMIFESCDDIALRCKMECFLEQRQ
ncbi:unnamed protein product [Clavelina lepadiformis]|uniref:Uncharacterized protein n=1 Tax=Clavelina lepadiformis TaxID=159417 RepID=A0ABP0F955_CLALP